jgi:hypothetical protein
MTNERIVACARSWLGTRFHHQGRLKKTDKHRGGVDCLGLLAGIASELQLIRAGGECLASLDEIDYSHSPDVARLKGRLSEILVSVDQKEMKPGDILLLRIDNNPQHLAIVSDRQDGYGIIHAYAPARAVVEHVLDSWWCARIDAIFRYV